MTGRTIKNYTSRCFKKTSVCINLKNRKKRSLGEHKGKLGGAKKATN